MTRPLPTSALTRLVPDSRIGLHMTGRLASRLTEGYLEPADFRAENDERAIIADDGRHLCHAFDFAADLERWAAEGPALFGVEFAENRDRFDRVIDRAVMAARDPLTASDVAEIAGFNPRVLQEWLGVATPESAIDLAELADRLRFDPRFIAHLPAALEHIDAFLARRARLGAN